MTRTAKKMFKDIGYEYSEEYITDDITNEKVLERIQYKKGYETIKFYIRGKFWGKSRKKGTYCAEYEFAYATMEETEAIVQQCKELNWINNTPKEETNFEHYFEKIKELVSMHFRNPQAIANGLMAVSDEDILCTGLITDAILDWCKNPYKNRDYCLSEFEYELLESYLNSDEKVALLCIKDVKVLQNMQKKGYFRNVDNYTPIKDILECSEIKKGEKKMKFIVDEINPEECPFFIDEEWVEDESYETEMIPHVYFQKNRCKLAPYNLCKEDIYFDGCMAKSENGKCPFCITFDEYQQEKNGISL